MILFLYLKELRTSEKRRKAEITTRAYQIHEITKSRRLVVVVELNEHLEIRNIFLYVRCRIHTVFENLEGMIQIGVQTC